MAYFRSEHVRLAHTDGRSRFKRHRTPTRHKGLKRAKDPIPQAPVPDRMTAAAGGEVEERLSQVLGEIPGYTREEK